MQVQTDWNDTPVLHGWQGLCMLQPDMTFGIYTFEPADITQEGNCCW